MSNAQLRVVDHSVSWVVEAAWPQLDIWGCIKLVGLEEQCSHLWPEQAFNVAVSDATQLQVFLAQFLNSFHLGTMH